jgi:hypothetical protein
MNQIQVQTSYVPMPSVPVVRACDIKLSEFDPASRFYCELTGMRGTLKFDRGVCWFVTGGKIGRMSKANLHELTLVQEAA